MPTMSTPDRYLASGGSARQSPAPDGETSSSSGHSDDFSDMFDWDLYHAPDGIVTNVTTPSELSAHGRVDASPPDFSPIGADSDGDISMSDVGNEVPYALKWPGLSGPPPTRHEDIHIPDSPPLAYSRPSLLSSRTMSPVGRCPQLAPPVPSQKKPRVLGSPDKTNQVRELGSCYHCKRNKSACAPGVCDWCTKSGPIPELACIRKPLETIRGSWTGRWNWDEFPPRREELNESRFQPIFISFSSKPNSPCLRVNAAPFAHEPTGNRYGLVFPAPTREQLVRWVKEQMRWEGSSNFESCINQFHIQYVQNGADCQIAQGQRELVAKVLEMKAMWKIWSCKELFVRAEAGSSKIQPLGARFASIQDRIRYIAGNEISILERDVLSGIDGYLKKETGRLATNARSALNMARWLSLMQIILIYRQALSWMLQQEHTDTVPFAIGVGSNANERRRKFRPTTEELLRAVIVIYFELFHKKSAVEGIMKTGIEVFGNAELHQSFHKMSKTIPSFYQQVISQGFPEDKFFTAYVVERELPVLTPKGRSSRK